MSYQYSQYGAGDFWGQLFDNYMQPSQLFCRLADSLYFYADQNSPDFPNTQYFEPAKYGTLLKCFTELDPLNAAYMVRYIQSVYDIASLPYSIVQGPSGPMSILDRQGFLRWKVWEVTSDPSGASLDWNRYISSYNLRDPMTGAPFPPVTASAFPSNATPQAEQGWNTWMALIAQKRAADGNLPQNQGYQSYGSSDAGYSLLVAQTQVNESTALGQAAISDAIW